MDDEITGMFQVAKILDDLDDNARARVLRWAADKYGIDLGQLAAEETDVESTDETILGAVDPAKVAKAKEAREAKSAEASAPKLEVKPASSLEPEEAPPERDPERPSFLDTSFRMYSGKQRLKKEKGDNE